MIPAENKNSLNSLNSPRSYRRERERAPIGERESALTRAREREKDLFFKLIFPERESEREREREHERPVFQAVFP